MRGSNGLCQKRGKWQSRMYENTPHPLPWNTDQIKYGCKVKAQLVSAKLVISQC